MTTRQRPTRVSNEQKLITVVTNKVAFFSNIFYVCTKVGIEQGWSGKSTENSLLTFNGN